MSDTSDEDLESLYKVVGFVVIHWGHAEQSLDLIVATLYQHFGGSSLVKRMPKMLEPKLDFLAKALQELRELDEFIPLAQRVISEFKRLSQYRHDFIHGAVADTTPEDGRFNFVKLDVGKDIHTVREFQLDGRDFPALSKDLVSLGANTVKLARLVGEKGLAIHKP